MPTKKKFPKSERYKLPDAYRVEFKSIDSEHGALVNILNDGLSEFDRNEKVTFLEFDRYFQCLWHEMSTHFRHEEAKMEQLEYPDFLSHKNHHAEILSRLALVRDEAAARGYVDRSIIENIFDTIMDDMLRADLGFKGYLDEKRILH